MKSVSKAMLVTGVAAATGVSRKDSRAVIEAFLGLTTEHLVAGERVQLTGFGSLELRTRLARANTVPGQSDKVVIPAGKYAAFRASEALRSRIE